jgi:DNA repair protein RecN (Recombination protein N)
MLQHISIRHYALIEHLEIQFDEGLNILTGETGSGKSIILGALSLILGDRAESRVVQEGKQKCVVEGIFRLEGENLIDWFASADLDYDVQTTLRREILSNGKSRAFINDTPVNLKVLRDLAMRLLDIHSQHQTLQINDTGFQLEIVDRFAETQMELTEYRSVYKAYSESIQKLNRLTAEALEARKEMDFIQFQLEELESIKLEEIDEESLEESFQLLTNAEDIAIRLNGTLGYLSDGDKPAMPALRSAVETMNHLAGFSKTYGELAERLKSSLIELDDVSREIELLAGKVEVDPQELERINELRGMIFKLEQKHGVSGVAALISLRNEKKKRIEFNDHVEDAIAETETVLKDLKVKLIKTAEVLSAKRQKKMPAFSAEIVNLLKMLNMKQARFEVQFEKTENPTVDGFDRLSMLFSANAGRKPEQLKHVASGGELSRLMLAVKKLSSNASQRTTIVFDEIDSGVSGEVANSMGRIMKDMAQAIQVICITHLPQIAAKGTAHFKVFKTEIDGLTKTGIERLDENNRIGEIAQMLSGSVTTEAALANARDLLYLN